MGGVLDTFKTLKLWQVGVLAAVLVGAVGGAYGVYALAAGPGRTRTGENQQLIPVRYGNLVNQVSTNGSLMFPNRIELTFGTQGTVGELLVQEGTQVKAGEVIARLDAATVASLERAVAQARVNLRNAEEALAKEKAPYTPDDVARAQLQVDSAKTSLANAERDLKLAQKDWTSKLQTAQEAVTTAKDGYGRVFAKWLGIELSKDQVDMAPETLLGSWKVDLTVLFAPDRRFQDIGMGWLVVGSPPDAPATPWSEPVVYVWLNMFPGSILPTCENGVVPPQGACIKKEMDNAWDAYEKERDSLDTVQTQAAKAIASAESALARAKDSLAAAEQALADLQTGPDPLDVALREAEVTSARVALETAVQRLEGATLRATMAGTVSAVGVVAGQTVNANAVIAEVVDPTVVELDGIVNEIDVLFVRQGAEAAVTMDALPGQVLRASVSTIASAARSQQGVVSYPIRIQVQVPQGVELREGLSATASIVIRQENNVLLVPIQALYGTFDQPVVRVMTNGRVEERPVVLGNSDDYWVAVRQGLADGEQVVMEAQAATTSQLGFGQAMRGFQGQLSGREVFQAPGGQGQRQGTGGTGQRAQPTPRAQR
ncbi:MAG: HlyD family efflux transporter periplasmic adaptor subunit [Chloroflexi bacterium]|nr:HlyD family efflux transporter periplasmic adaptor subunit [Chloroflexota bacterium]